MSHLSISRDCVRPPGALSCKFKLKVKRCNPLMTFMSWQVQQLHHAHAAHCLGPCNLPYVLRLYIMLCSQA